MDFQEILPQNTPDIQIETDWTAGLSGLPNQKKRLLLMGQQLGTGSLTIPTASAVQTPRRITSTTQAIGLYGKGSNLAVMCEYALKAAPRATLYAVAYKAGTTPGTATINVVLATPATGAGELKVWIMGELFRCGIASGDTETEVGDAIVLAINAHPNLPAFAANAAGTVTIEAMNDGIEGNSISVRSEITDGIAMTSVDGGAYLATGTVVGDPETQLASMEADRYHIIGIECDDATALAVLQAHQEAASTPSQKRWGFGISGTIDTSANTQTLANALDSYRMQVAWQEAADRPCFVVAAVFAAVRALYGPKASLDNEVLTGLLAQHDEDAWPNAGDIETAVTEGIVVLKPMRGSGKVQVVRSVVTRQTTPLSYRDHTIAEKSDYTDETVIAGVLKYQGKTLKTASPPGQPETVTPGRLTAVVNERLFALDKEDILQGVKAAIAAKKNYAEVNASDPDRIDAAFEYFPTRTAHSIMAKKVYVTAQAA